MSTRPRRTGQALLSRPENAKRDGDAVTEAREINRNAREIRRMPLCSGPTETLGTRAQVGTVGGRDLDGDPFAHPAQVVPPPPEGNQPSRSVHQLIRAAAARRRSPTASCHVLQIAGS